LRLGARADRAPDPRTSQPQLDADGIGLGLIGVLEMLWQDFAFPHRGRYRSRRRETACHGLSALDFPRQFAAPGEAGVAGNDRRPAGWVYGQCPFVRDRAAGGIPRFVQFVAHQARIPRPGDFLGVDLGFERALIVRDGAGEIRAFRNSCSEAPHILIAARTGRVNTIQCAVHGLQFELDGRRRGARGAADLTTLDLRLIGDLILVRSAERRPGHAPVTDAWAEFSPPPGSRPLGWPVETAIAADWKLVIEQWLESTSGAPGEADEHGWSARSYERLFGIFRKFRLAAAIPAAEPPDELRPDGFTLLQVLPSGPGRCLLRRHEHTVCRCRPARARRGVPGIAAEPIRTAIGDRPSRNRRKEAS